MFSGIGGSVFVLGLAIQFWLTGVLHISAIASYGVQAVVSVESNFLLNRWLTWRDRGTPFWTAFIRFNAQRVVTVTINTLLYIGLIRLGMNYLAANIVLTIAFTAVNFVIGDKLVFTPVRSRGAATGLAADPIQTLPMPKISRVPAVSVIIPCRNNETTIRAAVQSLLDQTYPALVEVMLVGSPDDTTWSGLTEIDDPRVLMLELATPAGVRDANFKRDYGIKRAAGDLVALLDSDMVLPREWMSKAYEALDESRASCVTGGMKSIRDDFWGRYTDHTFVGAKTPRVGRSYLVTADNFGVAGKPPITANILFKKELYEACPINPYWSHGSYEDYEWFWRVVQSG
jgi:putative flippase GtrA